MIVARQREHATKGRSAGGVGMFQRIDRAIDAGTLAIPDAEHAIEFRTRKQVDLLATPHRRDGEVFVEAGLKPDFVGRKELLRLPQRIVIDAKRRATIAGDEAGGI